MRKFVIAFFLATLIFSASCYAEDNLSVVYDAQNQSIFISGSVGTASGFPILMNITDSPDENVAFSSSNLPLISQLLITEANGMISEHVPLSDSLAAGKYKVFFSCKKEDEILNFTDTFMLVNQADEKTAELLSRINGGEDIYNIVSDPSNAFKLGIDTECLSAHISGGAAIASALNNHRYTAADFANTFTAGAAVSMLKSGDAPKKVLAEYATSFGSNTNQLYMLSDTAIEELGRLLCNYNYQSSSQSIYEIYEQCALLANLHTVPTTSYLKDLMLANSASIGINTSASSDYMSLNNSQRNAVFSNIVSAVKNASSISTIKTLFDTEVVHMKEKESADNAHSGGSSSGGGNLGGYNISGGIADDILIPDIATHNTPKFHDIAAHWAEKYILSLCETNVVSGFPDNSFRPDEPVTRGQFSKIAALNFHYSAPGNTVFSDVAADSWYAPYIDSLSAKNIILGSNGYFYPEQNLTRQDAAVIGLRLLQNTDLELNVSDTLNFKDSGEISDYARTAVSTLNAYHILTGDENGFRPFSTITRAEVCAFLYRLSNLVKGVQQ